MGKVKRLFIAEYENLNETMNRCSKGISEETDVIIILKHTDIALNESVSSFIRKWNDRVIKIISGCEQFSEESYLSYTRSRIKKYADKGTTVVFVGCLPLYEKLKGDISGYVGSVVAETKLQRALQNLEKKHGMSDRERRDAEDLGNAVGEMSGEPSFGRKADDDKKAETRAPTSEGEPKGTTLKNSTSENEPGGRGKPTSRKKPGGKEEDPVVRPGETNEQARRRLEKDIFNDVRVEDQQGVEYTEMDDEKANLLSLMFERLKDHLNKVVENEKELTDDDYSEVIIQLIKSPDVEDFKKCINTLNMRAKMDKIDADVFIIFKKESEYYIGMCDMCYKQDRW